LPDKTKKILKIALSKSDFVEVRFDFLKKEQIPETLEMIKKDLNRIVCTLRPKTEGGNPRNIRDD
jgi:3-dehydroquinate dehydratase-1